MVQHALPESKAEARFDAVWTELAARLDGSVAAEIGLDRERLHWMLPALIHLVDAARDQPAHRFTAAVRTRVIDLLFMGSAGDPALPPDHEAVVEHLIAVLTETLERLRSDTADDAQWSLQRAAPPMCG